MCLCVCMCVSALVYVCVFVCVCVRVIFAARDGELAIISLHRSDSAVVPSPLGSRLVSDKILFTIFSTLQARSLVLGGFS